MSKGKLSNEEIVEGFNKLRQEQRNIATQLSKFQGEKDEHSIVIEALKQVMMMKSIGLLAFCF